RSLRQNVVCRTYDPIEIIRGHDPAAHTLSDQRMARCTALVIGEAETRAAALRENHRRRTALPGVMWRDPLTGTLRTGKGTRHSHPLAHPATSCHCPPPPTP